MSVTSRWPGLRFTRRSLMLRLVFSACIIVVGLEMACCKQRRPHGPFWNKYQLIQPGMTEKEVKRILGPPDSIEGGGLAPSTLAWFERDQTIAVDFDVFDKATEKRFRAEVDGPWLRSRLKGGKRDRNCSVENLRKSSIQHEVVSESP